MTQTRTPDQQPAPDEEQWLTPGVRGIGTASFLADVGHEIPTALLPSLLTSTLGAPAAALGAIEGMSDALAGAARFGGGVLADDPARRRKVAVSGYATTAVLGAATAGATAVWQVGLLRAAAWTARGLRVPARNALLADIVPANAYGRAYGFERMMDNLGAIFGPSSLSAWSPGSASSGRSACRSSPVCWPLSRSSTRFARRPAGPAATASRSRSASSPCSKGILASSSARSLHSRSATSPPPC